MTSYFTRLLLLAFLLITSFSHAQTIDIESATRYWQLTDALRRNEPLTDQAWQSFLALPGNKAYVDAVYNDEQLARYRRAIEVAYMPRYDSLRQAKIKANVWYYVLANDYKEHEAEDRRYVAAMQQNPDYLGRMYTYAYEALPARNHTKVANLKIYYVMLGNDATSQQTGLVFSMRSVRDGNATKPGILEAHEMHHQLRTTSTHYDPTDPADDNLLWAFYSALNEGTADFTDKVPRLANPADSAEIRSWLLRPAPAVIQKIDSTIRVQAAGGAATPRHSSSTAGSLMAPTATCRAFTWLTPSRRRATASSCSTTPTTRWPSPCSTRKPPKRASRPRAFHPLRSATYGSWRASMPCPGLFGRLANEANLGPKF